MQTSNTSEMNHLPQDKVRANSPGFVPSDNPIHHLDEDTLGRATEAWSFARQVLTVDARQGVVAAVLGSWGSGKTSFINLARIEFDQASIPVLDFNPWMFSGTEQLVDSFFRELTLQLKIRPGFGAIAREVAEYGEIFTGMDVLSPIGPWIGILGALLKVTSKISQRRKTGVGEHRTRLEKALLKIDHPIIVVLDDIDRLSSSEIRDIFKLIRLTADFPNVIYIVAFDRKRVEVALTEEGVPGRDYLEKILQISSNVPAVPRDVLQRQTIAAIDNALSGRRLEPFAQALWPDIFMEIVHPLIRNMRDVRRYAAAISGTVRALEGRIELADIMALEAIRVFLPDVYGQLHRMIEPLTTTSGVSYGDPSDPKHFKAAIDFLMTQAGDNSEIVRSMIHRIFPAAERHIGQVHYGGEYRDIWLRTRRVANEEILRLYLERIPGESLLSFYDSEKAFAVISDRVEFDKYLRSLDATRIEDVIRSLESFQNEFRIEQVVAGTIVLLNLISAIPKRPLGMFEFDSRFTVGRVVYRLVRSARTPEEIEASVRTILPEVVALSGRLDLISIVGHREGTGHKLVSEATALIFERDLRTEIRNATAETLIAEWDLFRLLHFAKEGSHVGELPFEIPDSPALTLAILRSALNETRSQGANSRIIRRSQRLEWDPLIALFGNMDNLKSKVESLKAVEPKGEIELLSLVDKYMGGWRPEQEGG